MLRFRSFATALAPLPRCALPLPATAHLYTLTRSLASSPTPAPPKLRFDDSKTVYGAVPLYKILRGLLVFRLCGVESLVNNSERILDTFIKQTGESKIKDALKVVGRVVVAVGLRLTFFGHFCAGEVRHTTLASLNCNHRLFMYFID